MRPGRSLWMCGLVLAGSLASAQCRAEATEVVIGETYGLTHLPSYVVVGEKFIQKEAQSRGLPPIHVTFKRVGNGNVVADLLLSGGINVATSGLVPFLFLWDKVGARMPVKGIVSLSQSNIFLMSRDPRIHSIRDYRSTDRIAMTNVRSTTWAILLQMAAAKTFGWSQRGRFDALSVPMANGESTAAMLSGATKVASQMTMLPYTAMERASGRVHAVLNSKDVIGGPISATVAFTTVRFHDQNPELYASIAAAYQDADAFIAQHPEEAAKIYNEHEPQKGGVASILKMMAANSPDQLEFTTAPQGVKAFADFMAKTGLIKASLPDWRGYFFDNLANANGS